MKTLLTTILILSSLSGFGQSVTYKLLTDSAKISIWTGAYTGAYTGRSNTINPNTDWLRKWSMHVDNKPIMTISKLNPDSTYHVWVNIKSITWTSDSTFILKRKP